MGGRGEAQSPGPGTSSSISLVDVAFVSQEVTSELVEPPQPRIFTSTQRQSPLQGRLPVLQTQARFLCQVCSFLGGASEVPRPAPHALPTLTTELVENKEFRTLPPSYGPQASPWSNLHTPPL